MPIVPRGLGTALKPSHEPIVVARKPLVGTVAANVLEHGTGALNIDGCRIEHESEEDLATSLAKNPGRDDTVTSGTYGADRPQQSVNVDGRWPANVVLSERAAAELDEQSGESVSRIGKPRSGQNGDGWGMTATGAEYDDEGGPSRFFYCAKASRAERNAGLEGFEERQIRRLSGGDFAHNSGSTNSDKAGAASRNSHPTVKPINLMRWLVRLVTPPGGTVLDPFLGSGTTGAAAALEGFDFIGIEREAEYVAIAEARIAFWEQHQGREVEDVLEVKGRSDRDAQDHEERGQVSIFDAVAEAA